MYKINGNWYSYDDAVSYLLSKGYPNIQGGIEAVLKGMRQVDYLYQP